MNVDAHIYNTLGEWSSTNDGRFWHAKVGRQGEASVIIVKTKNTKDSGKYGWSFSTKVSIEGKNARSSKMFETLREAQDDFKVWLANHKQKPPKPPENLPL